MVFQFWWIDMNICLRSCLRPSRYHTFSFSKAFLGERTILRVVAVHRKKLVHDVVHVSLLLLLAFHLQLTDDILVVATHSLFDPC